MASPTESRTLLKAIYRGHHCLQFISTILDLLSFPSTERLFGKTWREEWVTLFDDSTLAWFKEKDRGSPEGALVIKEAPEMMAMGQWTLRIPARPDLPSGCHVVQLMAFGNRRRDKVHWLLAKNEDEVK